MRLAIRALVVAIGTVLLIAGGLSPDHAADARSQVARGGRRQGPAGVRLRAA